MANIIFIILGLVLALEGLGQSVGIGEPRLPVWTITTLEEGQEIRITVECSGYSVAPVPGGVALRMPGQASSGQAGTPDIPRLSKLISGLPAATAVLTLKGYDSTNIPNVVVAPVEGYEVEQLDKGARELRPYRRISSEVYDADQFWPEGFGHVSEAWIGTQKVVRVECYPVHYNPVTKTLCFYRRLEGVVRFER